MLPGLLFFSASLISAEAITNSIGMHLVRVAEGTAAKADAMNPPQRQGLRMKCLWEPDDSELSHRFRIPQTGRSWKSICGVLNLWESAPNAFMRKPCPNGIVAKNTIAIGGGVLERGNPRLSHFIGSM